MLLLTTMVLVKPAIEKIKLNPPDLILLDYMMPELSGIEVCLILKKLEETKHIPIVFLTGASSEKELKDIQALKPLGIIQKPIRAKTFPKEILKFWDALA